jgi:hypothetical protein
MVNGLWFILGIIEVYFQIWYRYLTIGIRVLSLAKEGKNVFSLFAEFFLRKKKRAAHFRFISEALRDEIGKTNWVFELLSEKYPISKKQSTKMEFGK